MASRGKRTEGESVLHNDDEMASLSCGRGENE